MTRSRSRSRRKNCRGGSLLSQLRKSAKSCGLKKYSRSRKCKLQSRIVRKKCRNVKYVSIKQQGNKKYKTRSRSRRYRWKHKISGKHIILLRSR